MKKILIMMLAAFAVFALVSCEGEPVVEPLAKDPKKVMESIELFFYVNGELSYGDLGSDCWDAFNEIVYYNDVEEEWLLYDEFKTNSSISYDSNTGKWSVTSEDCSFVFKTDDDLDFVFFDMKDNGSGAHYIYEFSDEETEKSYSQRERYFADFCGYGDLTGTAEYIYTGFETETQETETYFLNFNNVTFDDEGTIRSLSGKVSNEVIDYEDPEIDGVNNVTVEDYVYNGVKYDPDYVAFAYYMMP